MEIFIGVLKYTFVVALAVEGLLVARAVVALARGKAREAAAARAQGAEPR